MILSTMMKMLRILFLSLKEKYLFTGGINSNHLKPSSFKAWKILPDRQSVVELPCSIPNSSKKTEKPKSLIESSLSCSKKDLEEKVLKILELNGLDDENIESEVAS